MDGLHYDAYSNYSDGSTPRTPSPGSDLHAYHSSPAMHHMKPTYEPFVRAPEENAFGIDVSPAWSTQSNGPIAISHSHSHGAPRGSLLHELYDHELPPDHVSHHPQHAPDVYVTHSAEPHYGSGHADWSAMHAAHDHQQSHHGPAGPTHHATLPPMRAAPHDSMVRRNTFPYVRHDQDANGHPHFVAPGGYVDHHSQAGPMLAPYGAGRPDVVYGEPMPLGGSPHLPLAAEPSALHEPYGHPHAHHGHPGGMYSLEGEAVKLEDGPSVIVPSQAGFYRPPSSGGMPMSAAYLSPHTGLPIQHTDDAASKETQYLRRRCFNCHTTEPPSWRRSTLNPGKIVCNKCGLYERTHLRPRPLRFDELRAGNKARKATKTPGANGASPKTSRATVKKEPREHLVGGSDAISRRASVSSNTSTTSSVGATSDWDDNASYGSAGSGFNSPAQSTFSIPRDSASASPPMHPNMVDGGIRLPNAPLSDIATLDLPQRKGSSPAYFAAPMYGSPRLAPANSNDAFRRNTLPLGADIPNATGWQSVSADFGTPQGVQGSPKTTPRANSVTVA